MEISGKVQKSLIQRTLVIFYRALFRALLTGEKLANDAVEVKINLRVNFFLKKKLVLVKFLLQMIKKIIRPILLEEGARNGCTHAR
jgi:hypothetical protein